MHKSTLRDQLSIAVDELMKAAIHHETSTMVVDDISAATGNCVGLLAAFAREGHRPIDAARLAQRLRNVAELLEQQSEAASV